MSTRGSVTIEPSTIVRIAIPVGLLAAALAIVMGILRVRSLQLSSEVEATVLSSRKTVHESNDEDWYDVSAMLATGRRVEFRTRHGPYEPGNQVTLRVIESTGQVIQEDFIFWLPTIVPAAIGAFSLAIGLAVKNAKPPDLAAQPAPEKRDRSNFD